MACPQPASMDECTQKCRCSDGECVGTTFLCDDPCPGGFFDPASCTCDYPTPLDSYTLYIYRETSGAVYCPNTATPGAPAFSTGCSTVFFPNVQNIKITTATTSESFICGAGGESLQYTYNFIIEGEDANGNPKFVQTGWWYVPDKTYSNNQVTGTNTSTWQITGIFSETKKEFVYGDSCAGF